VLGRLFEGFWGKKPARVPEGRQVYAVGDIHGCDDLLRRLHAMIAEDAAAAPPETRLTVVYLGDYVDRGEGSREVIDLLLDNPLVGFERVHLIGNHEDSFLEFLQDDEIGPAWFSYGGDATAESYGAIHVSDGPMSERFLRIQKALRENVPPRHLEFLSALSPYHVIGDYLFVHAGVRPGVPLPEQSPKDLYWIRDDFIRSRADHGRVVVHGHTITPKPDRRPNRIGIDTGAYDSGVLTCLVLEGEKRRFLATG